VVGEVWTSRIQSFGLAVEPRDQFRSWDGGKAVEAQTLDAVTIVGPATIMFGTITACARFGDGNPFACR